MMYLFGVCNDKIKPLVILVLLFSFFIIIIIIIITDIYKVLLSIRQIYKDGGAHGVMVIVEGNGHGDTSSNPGQDWLHFT